MNLSTSIPSPLVHFSGHECVLTSLVQTHIDILWEVPPSLRVRLSLFIYLNNLFHPFQTIVDSEGVG